MPRPAIIDRYLLRQFVRTFVILFVSFTGLYVVVDTFTNLDQFITRGQQHGSLLGMLWEYYGYRTLWFFNLMSGVLALIAAMFTVTAFQRNNELTALLAAGISKRRIVTAIIGGAITVSVLAMLMRELVLPNVRDKLSRNIQNWDGKAIAALHPRYDNRTNVFIGGGGTIAAEQRIEQPNFRLPYDLQDYGVILSAATAYYRPAREGRPGGYLLAGVEQPRDLASRPSLKLGDEPIVITPQDADWLAADQCFVVSDVAFEQLEGNDAWRRFASTAELIAGLRNASLDFSADVRVAIHARLVQPVLDVALLFLGLPLILKRENRNVFAAIGLCGLLVLGFMLMVISCHWLGAQTYVSAARAAWLPVLIAVPAAVWISQPLRE